MPYKSSLHLHTAEDPTEQGFVKYTIYELIDRASALDFKILALTCHNFFAYKNEYGDYAKNKGILLIPGIEITIKKNDGTDAHVVVLNCNAGAKKIKNLNDLKEYKKSHPEIFIIAAHPNFHFNVSLGLKTLEENIEIFDAIENSWFYCWLINLNNGAKRIAKKYHKPFIATADLHQIKGLNQDYALIEAENLTPSAIFTAIKNNRFTNYSEPKSLYLMFEFVWQTLLYQFTKPKSSENESN
jgi:predicted metal-dependent phosphoesterase TrpH